MKSIWNLLMVLGVCGVVEAQSYDPYSSIYTSQWRSSTLPALPALPTLPTYQNPYDYSQHSSYRSPYGNSYSSPYSSPSDDYIVSPRGQYLGKLNDNKYDPESVANPYGAYGSRYSPNSINNPYGTYGSRYSPESATNPYTSEAPRIYDGNTGQYEGRLSANKYDPENATNPYSTYYNRNIVRQQILTKLTNMSDSEFRANLRGMSSQDLNTLLELLKEE